MVFESRNAMEAGMADAGDGAGIVGGEKRPAPQEMAIRALRMLERLLARSALGRGAGGAGGVGAAVAAARGSPLCFPPPGGGEGGGGGAGNRPTPHPNLLPQQGRRN